MVTNAARLVRSHVERRQSPANAAADAASEMARIGDGAIARPIQSARYAARVADANSTTAPAAMASAVMTTRLS